MSNSNSQTFLAACDSGNHSNKIESQTPNVKKRHRRMKSSGVKNNEYDGESTTHLYGFLFVFCTLQITKVMMPKSII